MAVGRTISAWILLIALAGLIAAACGNSSGDDGARVGEPRSFALGFSSLPRELNVEAYAEAIEFSAEHGDIVLIQRNIPWSNFLPGAGADEALAKSTAAEREAVRDAGVDLFFAIDPTDGATGRDRLGGLPAEMQGRRFDDPDVRAAFRSYAEYVALNYRPDYLALGVEMNLYYQKNQDDFDNFRSLYQETYAAVKEAAPDTQITVTFQYEDLQGLLPRDDQHFAEWQLLNAFEPSMDLVAISTYPSFAFRDVASMPENYYSQIRAFTDRPVAIAEMGFSSAAGTQNVNSGTEEAQAAFVQRVLEEVESLDMPFAVWFAIWDPAYARDTSFAAFQHVGLLRSDSTEKPAWGLWSEVAHRPFEPAD